jgi:RNA polymerase sigma-70 factor (ECF subfamily)
MDDDMDAVHRLKIGDIGGLEILVTRYQVKAMRSAFLILRDEQAAEDIVQETFLRVFNRIRRFDESRPFGPYLLRSVVNAALDAAQSFSKEETVDDELESLEGLLQHAGSLDAQIEFNSLKEEIRSALEKLSPRQRAVIVMRYYLEMSEKEMADNLRAAPGTVKWLLNAARKRLRGLLGKRSAI